MLQKLEYIKERWQEVERELSNPATMSDMKRFAQLNKEYKDLTKIVEEYKIYSNVISNIDANKNLLSNEKDEEMREMAKMELDELLPQQEQLEEKIRVMLIPQDPEDSKNAIVEIRGGTGGDEAALFAGDLYRMYTRYCERKGWSRTFVALCRCGAVVRGLWSLIFGGCVGCCDEETPQVCRVAISLATRSLLPTGGGSSEWHERVGICCRRQGGGCARLLIVCPWKHWPRQVGM